MLRDFDKLKVCRIYVRITTFQCRFWLILTLILLRPNKQLCIALTPPDTVQNTKWHIFLANDAATRKGKSALKRPRPSFLDRGLREAASRFCAAYQRVLFRGANAL